MKRLLLFQALCLCFISCKKEPDAKPVNTPGETDMANLVIDQAFNWSSSIKGALNVTLVHDDNFDTEESELWVINDDGKRLARFEVMDDMALLNVTLPASGDTYYLYYPSTGDQMVLEKNYGNVNFELHTDFINDYESLFANADQGNGKKSTWQKNSSGVNLLGNGDFELNNFQSHNFSLTVAPKADDGNWYKINNNFTSATVNGSKVFKANNNKTAMIGQVVSVTPSDSFSVAADVGGQAYYYIMWYKSNGFWLVGYNGYGANNSPITGNGVVPQHAAYAAVIVYTYDNGWIDNVEFNTAPANIDGDGDGVADSEDDFPNDPNRAYSCSYPLAGNQTLAFEDLWPMQGDFDFNDMVITSKAQFTTNAANELVDAHITMSLDAVGAGVNNGLAFRFLNPHRQPFSSNIIASVSGNASLDPDNANGVIVFQDAFAAQTSYYTNNGSGPSETPDTLKFTINFNQGVSTSGIVPDIYIFRSNNRGHEIHLDGFTGSAAADNSLFNTGDDFNGTYNTENGLPWALEVVTTPEDHFQHPLEKIDILVAYPQFQQWAESNGSSSAAWMMNPNASKVFVK